MPQSPISLANLIPPKKGEIRNPKGRPPNIGSSVKEWLNNLSEKDLTIDDLKNMQGPIAKRIAAQRLMAMLEHPEDHIGGQAKAFDQVIGNAAVEAAGEKQAPPQLIIVAPGMPLPAALMQPSAVSLDAICGPAGEVVDVAPIGARPLEMVENATYSQLESKTTLQDGSEGVPVDVVDDQVVPNPTIEMGRAFVAMTQQKCRFVLVESARGTGKTRAILTWMVIQALKYPKSVWQVVRSSRTRLTDTAIKTFVTQVLPQFPWMPIPDCQRSQLHTYKLPNGSEFIFQGLDDIERQQSVECAGVYVVEGCEIDNLDTIVSLTGSMRETPDWPGLSPVCIVDCNPDYPNHPLNMAAEEVSDDLRGDDTITREQYEAIQKHNSAPPPPGKWKRIIATWPDNPGYFDVVKWAFTKAGETYIEGLRWLVGNLRKRWLKGLWTAATGSVFGDVWDDAVHLVDDFEPPSDWPLDVGWDPGRDHVTGMPWVWTAPNGDWYVGDEVYEGGLTVAEHVEKNVMPRLRGRTVRNWYGDPHEFFSTRAQAGDSCAVQARNAGLALAIPWADLRGPAKTAGVNAVIEILQNTVIRARTGQRRGPCLYVMRRCVNMRAEFQSWSYKRKADGSIPDGDDAYQDRQNDLLDGLIGMIATGSLVYEKPGEPRALVVDT